MVFFCHFIGLKLKIQKNEKNVLEILANYTYIPNFMKIGPFVWSLAMVTDTHTYGQTFFWTLFWTQGTSKWIFPLKSQSRIFLPSQYFLHTHCIWDSGDLKMDISTKISKSNVLPSQYFLHTYCIWEKVKNLH